MKQNPCGWVHSEWGYGRYILRPSLRQWSLSGDLKGQEWLYSWWEPQRNTENFHGFPLLKVPRVCFYCDNRYHRWVLLWLAQTPRDKMTSRALQALQSWGCFGCKSTSGTETRGCNPQGSFPVCFYMFWILFCSLHSSYLARLCVVWALAMNSLSLRIPYLLENHRERMILTLNVLVRAVNRRFNTLTSGSVTC